MYTPRHFAEEDAATLAELIEAHNFGTLVTVVDGRPFASHIPFLFDREANVLRAHVARANEQWRHFADGGEVLAVFGGPHAYISPTWYVNAGVPTWNYAVAHVYGVARALQEAPAVKGIVEALSSKHERVNETPWVPSYDARMLDAIVGIEVAITAIEGKRKLSQNRSAADRAAVIAKLEATGHAGDAAMAQLMRENEPRRA